MSKRKPAIGIRVEGGIIQSVFSDQELGELFIIDYDTDGVDEEELSAPFGDPAIVSEQEVDYVPSDIETLKNYSEDK